MTYQQLFQKLNLDKTVKERQKGLKSDLPEGRKKSMRGKRDRRGRSLGRNSGLQGKAAGFLGGSERPSKRGGLGEGFPSAVSSPFPPPFASSSSDEVDFSLNSQSPPVSPYRQSRESMKRCFGLVLLVGMIRRAPQDGNLDQVGIRS
jgi:hypothetical protein